MLKSSLTRLVLASLCAPALIGVSDYAHAQKKEVFAQPKGMYKWVDEHGVAHYSSTIPPEANRNQIDAVAKNGKTKLYTEAQMTAEQAQEAKIQRQQQEEEKKKLRELTLRRKAVSERYETEVQIADEIKRNRQDWERKILPLQQKEKELAREIAKIEAGNGSKLQLAQLRKNQESNQNDLHAYERESAASLLRLEEDRTLWREARGLAPASAAPKSAPPSGGDASAVKKGVTGK